ncbi:MAG: condensation domain-containing protein [Pseudomonadota bacterium]
MARIDRTRFQHRELSSTLSIEDLLADLSRSSIKIWVRGGRLCYSAPPEVMTPEILALLGNRKNDIISFLTAHKLNPPQLHPVERDTEIPAAISQETFWQLEQVAPGTSGSKIVSGLHLTGFLQEELLKEVYTEIVRRHESLRTHFQTVNGRLIQRINPEMRADYSVSDLSQYNTMARKHSAADDLLSSFLAPFDLSRDVLLRVRLIKLAEDQHVLLQVAHHIASDAWSTRLIDHEFAVLYEAFSKNKPSPLPEIHLHFADFAVWQDKQLQAGAFEPQIRYWRHKLDSGHMPRLDLPVDGLDPRKLSFRTARYSMQLSKPLSNEVRNFSHNEDCTLSVTLIAALKMVLTAMTGQVDVRIGTIVATRSGEAFDSIVGLFINTVILRTHLSGNPTIQEVVHRVKESVFEAYQHRDVPFECLVRDFERDPSFKRASLIQVMFLFDPAIPAPTKIGEVTRQPLSFKLLDDPNLTITTFDLVITMRDDPEGIVVCVVYKTQLFRESTIAQMVHEITSTIEAMTTNPQRRIRQQLDSSTED